MIGIGCLKWKSRFSWSKKIYSLQPHLVPCNFTIDATRYEEGFNWAKFSTGNHISVAYIGAYLIETVGARRGHLPCLPGVGALGAECQQPHSKTKRWAQKSAVGAKRLFFDETLAHVGLFGIKKQSPLIFMNAHCLTRFGLLYGKYNGTSFSIRGNSIRKNCVLPVGRPESSASILSREKMSFLTSSRSSSSLHWVLLGSCWMSCKHVH